MDLQQIADESEIRRLLAKYSHHADRKEPQGQAAVFTLNGRVRLYQGDPFSTEPIDTIDGRDNLAATFASLTAQYEVTTYLLGQSLISLDGDQASGETYCLAMHVLKDGDDSVLVTMSIRYIDTFTRTDHGWLIADRQHIFDWTDRRPTKP